MITNAVVLLPLKDHITQHQSVTGQRYQLNLCSGSNVVKQHYLSHSAVTTHHLWYTNYYFLWLGKISRQSSPSQSAYLARMAGWGTAAAQCATCVQVSNSDTFSYRSYEKVSIIHSRTEVNAYSAFLQYNSFNVFYFHLLLPVLLNSLSPLQTVSFRVTLHTVMILQILYTETLSVLYPVVIFIWPVATAMPTITLMLLNCWLTGNGYY